jgi:trimeric autotransporter adhesin
MQTVGLTVARHPLGSIVLQFSTAFHMVFAAAAQQGTEALQTALSSSTSSSDLQRVHSRASLADTAAASASSSKRNSIDVSTAKHACSTLRGGAATRAAAAATTAVHSEPLALSLRKAVALTADCLLCLHVTLLWRWPCLCGSDVSSELALEALISALTPHLPELWLLCLAVYQREDAALLERVTSLSTAHTSSSSSSSSNSSAKQTTAAAAAAAAAATTAAVAAAAVAAVPLTETLGVPESCWPRSQQPLPASVPSRDLLTGTTDDDEHWQATATARAQAAAAETAAAVEAYAAAASALAAVQAVACPLAKAQALVATVNAACECAQRVHSLRYTSQCMKCHTLQLISN